MSPWKELIEYKNLSKLGFHETLTGGQCFGWTPPQTIRGSAHLAQK